MSTQSDLPFAKLNKLLIVLVLVGVGAIGILVVRPEIKQQKVVDTEISELEQIRDTARKTRDEHQRKLDWIRNDPEYLEIVARDVLDLYNPGEVVLRIDR